MEDKRTFLAVGLCLIVLVGWSYLGDYMGWNPKPPVTAQNVDQATLSAPAAPSEPLPVVPLFAPSEGKNVTVKTPLYTAVFHSGGGVLRSFKLARYAETIRPNSPAVDIVSQDAAATSPMGLVVNGQPSWSTGKWTYEGGDVTIEKGQTATLTFRGEVDGVRVDRVMTLNADTYLINETVLLRSNGDTAKNVRLGMTVGASSFGEDSSYDPTRLAWSDNGSYDQETDAEDLSKKGILKQGDILWAGVTSNYFMSMIAPADTANLTLKGRVQNSVWRLGLEREQIALLPGNETAVNTGWWFGPKELALLADAPNNLESSVDFGTFSFIARGLLSVLDFFHSYVNNWGVAILMLTLCIRIIFWPLSQKSYKSMEQMKRISPMVTRLKEKYGDDKETLNRELMQLYRTYKINPAGGCLPILVQLPVFFGLYQALLNATQLRHASFIATLPFTDIPWLADLSTRDPYYVTPLLMGFTMFCQQRMSPPSGDATQQKIFMFMPAIFTVMFLNFPSGLVVYWLANNILSITQQWWMLRKVTVPEPARKS